MNKLPGAIVRFLWMFPLQLAGFAVFYIIFVYLFGLAFVLPAAMLLTPAWMKIWRRGGKWWTCAVIVLGALQYVVPAIVLAPAYPGHMALAAGVIVSGGVLLRRRARPITIAMLSLAVCSVTLVMSYYEMYFRINEHEFVRRDETLAAVGRMVVAYEDAPEFSQMRRLAFNRPLDQLWVTRGYDRPEELPSLMRVALADGHFDIGAQTPTQAVAVDEAAQRVYVGHFRTNTLAVYDAATCQELKRVETPQRPVRLVLSPDRATLWVLNDPDAFVTRWDARTLTKVADSEMVDIQMPYPFAYSAAEKRLYLSFSMLDLHILLVELDAETLAVKRNKTIGVTPARDMLVDENAGRLYVARPLLARVEAYDLRSLEKLFSLPAPMGVYSLTTTHDGRSLFAGSFTTGELWKIDIGARKRTWRGFVGRRIRHLATHPDTGEIYGTSALGLFVIDPNKC